MVVEFLKSEGLVTQPTPGSRDFSFDPQGDFQDLSINDSRFVTFTYQTEDSQRGDGTGQTADSFWGRAVVLLDGGQGASQYARWSRQSGGMVWKFLTFLLNINRRNHRKLCVVDGENAWLGSFNITADHLPVAAGGQGWRDYGVELTGPRVATLVEGFESLWLRTRSRLRRGFLSGYLSNRSLSARALKNRFVARSVVTAQHRVWLVSAYFLPTASLRRALLQACRNGAEVCLLLPERSDVTVFPRLSSHYYHELLLAGARIFLYRPGILHAKALMVDDFAIMGSSNWNYRSTLHDLELDVVLRHADTLADLEAVMREDAAESHELSLAELRTPGLLSRLLYALRYWM